jgi:hypothetical protein
MYLPLILAHGALGAFDELIYLGIAVIFVGFMVVSWLRARNQESEDDEQTPPTSKKSTDRFKLD